ncbi:hypothetical protein NQ315_016410 [Exocentrus adspersus]|uniref:Uncharacterized protein n=1 Tax=Exocentrus adspersus TaxID=1586481 RepID=A0AAV8VQE5_9CUCU|nr:hypothetical protein NQ315_016410 [Exocentrus adspersus]
MSVKRREGAERGALLVRPNTKTTIAILNCLLARQLCFEDASCAAILEIIPRVCGPEVGKYIFYKFDRFKSGFEIPCPNRKIHALRVILINPDYYVFTSRSVPDTRDTFGNIVTTMRSPPSRFKNV